MPTKQQTAEFGAWVDQQIAGSGKTREEAVQWLGIDKRTVKRWMDGVSAPRPDKLIRIADRLGVPRREVFGRAGIDYTGPELSDENVRRLHVADELDDLIEGLRDVLTGLEGLRRRVK